MGLPKMVVVDKWSLPNSTQLIKFSSSFIVLSPWERREKFEGKQDNLRRRRDIKQIIYKDWCRDWRTFGNPRNKSKLKYF